MMTQNEIIELLQGAKFEEVDGYEFATNLESFEEKGCWVDSYETLSKIISSIGSGYIYRIKPEPKYVPFTLKDAELFWLKRINRKNYKSFVTTILAYDDRNVYFDDDSVRYEQLLNDYIFHDGSPAGRLV